MGEGTAGFLLPLAGGTCFLVCIDAYQRRWLREVLQGHAFGPSVKLAIAA